MTQYESFEHEPFGPPQTVRDLVRALGVPDEVALTVPDDRLVVIATQDRPGGSMNGEQIVAAIDIAADVRLPAGDDISALYLEGDFPAGTYERVADSDRW
ncbi:hypothetical protein ACIA49_39000 [Kribbella sp. NPDC051587]|uniref:hypothetical protein n=1 Tax=Kribbella sp. NPDC051587 TaxID=3364119 RepID=UPI0037BDB7B5